MGDRSGLNDLDVAVLRVLADMDADQRGAYVKSARALEALYTTAGIPPLYGYDVMCNLAAPWSVHLRTLEPHGNFGSPDFGAANPRYTEVRLSAVGMLAAAAERGDGPPVPIGMVNGDLHLDGLRQRSTPSASSRPWPRSSDNQTWPTTSSFTWSAPRSSPRAAASSETSQTWSPGNRPA